MKILTDLQNIVSAASNIIVNTTKKTDTIISNVMDVGVATTGVWKSEAEQDAQEAQETLEDRIAAFKAKQAKNKKTSTK